MGFQPTVLGHRVLEETFKAGPSTGIIPFRVVMFDNVATPMYGTQWLAPIKHPSTSFTNGEKTAGVAVGPVLENTVGSDGLVPASAWAAIAAIGQNKAVDVRTQGVVPILCDDSTDGTNILAGDKVRISTSTTTSILSQTVSMKGCIAKAALTNNVPSANQHVVGLSYQKIAPAADSSIYCLVRLEPAEY